MMCWKRYASEQPHFAQIVDVIASFLEHVNNKRVIILIMMMKI